MATARSRGGSSSSWPRRRRARSCAASTSSTCPTRRGARSSPRSGRMKRRDRGRRRPRPVGDRGDPERRGELEPVACTDPDPDKRRRVGSTACRSWAATSELPRLLADGVEGACLGIGGIGDNGPRARLYERLRELGFALPTVVHARAVVAGSATIGAGDARCWRRDHGRRRADRRQRDREHGRGRRARLSDRRPCPPRHAVCARGRRASRRRVRTSASEPCVLQGLTIGSGRSWAAVRS